MNKVAIIVSILALSGVLFGAKFYFSPHDISSTKDMSPVVLSEQTDAVATVEGDAKVFNLETAMYYFKPNVIKVKKGDKVKVTINNVDKDDNFEIVHDFAIDELGVKSQEVGEGQSGSVEFTADKVGTFEFYCTIGKHREKGQFGSFIVTE